MSEHAAQHDETAKSFDFEHYADALHEAVAGCFTVQKLSKELPGFQATVHFDEDLEIDLGVTVARLKRKDVSAEEKIALATSAGNWVKIAAQDLTTNYLGIIANNPDLLERMAEQSRTNVVEVKNQFSTAMDTLFKLSAMQDRFMEQHDPHYVSWQKTREKQEACLTAGKAVFSAGVKQLERLVRESPSMHDNGYLQQLKHIFTAHIKNVESTEIFTRRMMQHYGVEVYSRANNAMVDPREFYASIAQHNAQSKKLLLEMLPASEFSLRHVVATTFSELGQEYAKILNPGQGIQ